MSGRVALIARLSTALVAMFAAGCSQPGTPIPAKQAAELDVATSRISVACGYEEELTAYRGANSSGLASIESIAVSGARKLALVYRRDQSDIYQGESVGAIVSDSVSLLGGCRLPVARQMLERALRERR